MMELDHGLGRVTWWGFSPWSSLAGPSVLLVGAGDPRHLVRSLAASQEARQFFILEQNIQVYCRQILLMTLLSDESTERHLRARMYLEILGNTLLTEETAAWVRKTSSRLLQALRRRKENERFQSVWDFSLLKDKELDVMEEIFSKWKTGSEEGEQNIQEFWIQRQQKFLGERWGGREGVADMDFHLHLVERGGANINKRDFLRWRENGVAFKVTEDASLSDLMSNVTLVSGEGASLGYWGDVMTGPFISYESELKYDWSLQDSQNINNVEDCSLTIKHLEEMIDKIQDNGSLTNTTFVPLSLSSSTKLEKTLKSRGPMDTVWVGLSMTHLVNQTFPAIIHQSGQLLLETPLYLLSLNKQLLESFRTKAQEIGKNSGFRCEDSDYDVCKTFCIKLLPETNN